MWPYPAELNVDTEEYEWRCRVVGVPFASIHVYLKAYLIVIYRNYVNEFLL